MNPWGSEVAIWGMAGQFGHMAGTVNFVAIDQRLELPEESPNAERIC